MVEVVHPSREHCVRAVRSRDARFDGWFFTAVTSTRIYCRPSCPVVPPKVENMTFYPSSAAAQRAGFRACKRCRPDASPGSPRWDERADVVARAVRLISDGVVDREGVGGLAAHLGYSVRQVERQVRAELGAGPLAVARAQRAQTARLMIETTAVPMSEVAMAAGFSSIRTFNETVREVFGLTPSALRARSGAQDPAVTTPGEMVLRLPFRRPLDADSLFGALAAAPVPGVEEWRGGTYRRTLRLPHGHGVLAVTPPRGEEAFVGCRLSLTDFRDLAVAINRCRRLLDLDADPVAVDEHLRTDPALAGRVVAAPGRRIPRTVAPAELAVRAVLGRGVSATTARARAGRLAHEHGDAIVDPAGGLTRLFPTSSTLAAAGPDALGLPPPCARTVAGLARALAEREVVLDAGADRGEARRALLDVVGLDPSTVETVAMRALGDPDAFPASERHAAAAEVGLDGHRLEQHSRRWSPWRSYACRYLLDREDVRWQVSLTSRTDAPPSGQKSTTESEARSRCRR